MILKNLFILLLVSSLTAAKAQIIIINGEEGSPILSWKDFKGRPDNSSPYFAYTYWNVSYKYDAFQFKGDTVAWDVKIILDLTNSWKKKDKISDTLLKHEQGHFDIGRICAAETQARIKATVFLKTSDYKEKLRALVMGIGDKYKLINKQYDQETNHGANKQAQWKWDAFFLTELNKYK